VFHLLCASYFSTRFDFVGFVTTATASLRRRCDPSGLVHPSLLLLLISVLLIVRSLAELFIRPIKPLAQTDKPLCVDEPCRNVGWFALVIVHLLKVTNNRFALNAC
jgi:hypothetical protein